MDIESLIQAALAAVGAQDNIQGVASNVDDDDVVFGTDDQGLSDMDKQRASLQTYLGSLPYECESEEYMHGRLEEIVGKIYVCAKARNWLVLTTWDGMLQCWLLMRYPMPRSTRAKLVRVYYDLCLLPGVETRVIRSWADMLSRLLSNKSGGSRKLEISDLELPWTPLWDALQKELWPKKRIQDHSRNLINILLYVAEQCKRYFSPSEIPHMLSVFIPRTTKESIMTMVPVMTSFLPLAQAQLYLPALFAIWEASNSSIIDDRFLELAGDLSEEYVLEASEHNGLVWRDIGIWSESQWHTLIGKGLASMNVPVGLTGASSLTAATADLQSDRQSLRIKKTISRQHALAKIIVYSLAADSTERPSTVTTPSANARTLPALPIGHLSGSKSLDCLEKLITSIESFFHPSNAGLWTLTLTTFLHRLTSEFVKRIKEEEQPSCKLPQVHRLTPSIRRNFVKILRTPALIAMFSKDPMSTSFSQGALRTMALLEPSLIMPELLERAYSGLEVVNETHRTTSVLGMLSGICAPLCTENLWLGGQKHIVPLLELCLPGIDLNDPTKTICATMFIVSVVQHVKIGELIYQTGLPLDSDDPADEMNVDETLSLPDGIDIGEVPRLSRGEERALTRDSTAGFADWVSSLFRRVFALYENLPEEGGRRNTTGGKQEEGVLKSIKSMLDVVCLHLSDKLFDLVLNLVYNYATSNAKSNAVRAFGQLVACLARVKPREVIAKFVPFCAMQIEEELKHGASSTRTTSSHAAIPSDTTFHWNLTILRGCLGYGGHELLKHRDSILKLLSLLLDKTKSERGFTGVGRLVTRILHTLAATYPINSRFVNTEEWENPDFDQSYYSTWGKLYKAQDVKIEWHVPSSDEISFVIQIMDVVFSPALSKVETLLQTPNEWDNIARNDFCRYLNACKAVWNGLPTFIQLYQKTSDNPCMYNDTEVDALLVEPLCLNAGFTLTDPRDPHYQHVLAYRTRYAAAIKHASFALRQRTENEDHIDAVIGVIRAIDTYLLDYGMTRSVFESLQTSHSQARELNRAWNKQKENSRLVFVKRAQVYHSGRIYMHALYRRRSSMDDDLIRGLVELSLSPYTRVRRQAQSVLHSVSGYYVRSARLILPHLYDALVRGSDPDRMKGALYVLGNKGIASYSLADYNFRIQHLLALLNCQHEEKPSVQKLVSNLSQELLTHLSEDGFHTDGYTLNTPQLDDSLNALATEFSSSFVNAEIVREAISKASLRTSKREASYQETVTSILDVALKPQTHWRYVQMALRFLVGLLRRDASVSPRLAGFFMELCSSPQPSIRVTAHKAVSKMLALVKIRSYSKSGEELWTDGWTSPWQTNVLIGDPSEFLAGLAQPLRGQEKDVYIDTIPTGFLSWIPSIKGYSVVNEESIPAPWSDDSQPCLTATKSAVMGDNFFSGLAVLWGQESSRHADVTELRPENVTLIKSLAKMFGKECLDGLLGILEPLILDSDRFKQRAGVEMLGGLLRGSKHWPRPLSERLWTWLIPRLDKAYLQIKPDTLILWECLFSYQLTDRDPRRSTPLLEWTLKHPFDFNGESVFEMSKQVTLFGAVIDSLGVRFNTMSDKYVRLFMDNLNNGYAEVRGYIAEQLYLINRNLWQPFYPSTDAFLEACRTCVDPLHIREPKYLKMFDAIVSKMPQLRTERLPPPRGSQSEYDKVGLTVLQWIWTSVYGTQACLVFPYIIRMMPEILCMAELSDSSDLQKYSTAVLYVISAVTPPADYVQIILNHFVEAIKSSTSWRIRLHALPALVVFFYRNLLALPYDDITKTMDCLLTCLADENVEVRAMASKALSGIVRCSQRQSIIPLKNRFSQQIRKTNLPDRRDPKYAESLKTLHSAILGVCALIESFPYSVEPWMPPLTEVLAPHATDPPPISTAIRQCASEFKKTHQDTWHKDQLSFDEDQLQSLSTMLVGTSYYA